MGELGRAQKMRMPWSSKWGDWETWQDTFACARLLWKPFRRGQARQLPKRSYRHILIIKSLDRPRQLNQSSKPHFTRKIGETNPSSPIYKFPTWRSATQSSALFFQFAVCQKKTDSSNWVRLQPDPMGKQQNNQNPNNKFLPQVKKKTVITSLVDKAQTRERFKVMGRITNDAAPSRKSNQNSAPYWCRSRRRETPPHMRRSTHPYSPASGGACGARRSELNEREEEAEEFLETSQSADAGHCARKIPPLSSCCCYVDDEAAAKV